MNAQQKQAQLQPVKNREIEVREFPEEFRPEFKSVGMITLTAREQLEAGKRAKDGNLKLFHELVKQAIVEFNDERVGLADGSVDRAFNSMPPQLIDLCAEMYADLHTASEDHRAGFRASAKKKVQ